MAFSTLLRRKGCILETLNNNVQQLQANLAPADQQLLDQYLAAQTQLATLTYQGPGNSNPEQYRQNLQQLRTQTKDLQAQLNNRSAEFRQQTQPITLEAVPSSSPTPTTPTPRHPHPRPRSP